MAKAKAKPAKPQVCPHCGLSLDVRSDGVLVCNGCGYTQKKKSIRRRSKAKPERKKKQQGKSDEQRTASK